MKKVVQTYKDKEIDHVIVDLWSPPQPYAIITFEHEQACLSVLWYQ